jgi:hypothetical protein
MGPSGSVTGAARRGSTSGRTGWWAERDFTVTGFPT